MGPSIIKYSASETYIHLANMYPTIPYTSCKAVVDPLNASMLGKKSNIPWEKDAYELKSVGAG
jgi:hypothetical protein